jgi:oligopeptide transport system permease protein
VLRYAVRRVLGLVPTFFVIVTLSFFVVRLAPGSPFASEKGIPPEVRQALEKRYRFDQPMAAQYVEYLKRLVLHGDLGLSTKYPRHSINEIIGDR